MELKLSFFFSTICVHIFDFYNMRHKFDYLDQLLNLIGLNDINDFLLQKLG